MVLKYRPSGMTEALLSSVGDELNALAGRRITRLSTVANEGDTAIGVETTYTWPAAGTLYMAGVRYSYSGKTPSTLTGLVPSVQETLRELTPLVDGSQSYSALDSARRSTLVAYAEGAYLDALGRNYGVFRFPGLDDDPYRAAIQALAYTPKGTIYAIETLLTFLVGAGNFEVFEDLVNYPNLVFITIDAALAADDPRGTTFFNAREAATSTSTTTVSTVYPVVGSAVDDVLAVFLAPETHHAAFDALPSAEPNTPWTYTGGQAEGTVVTLNGDGSARLQDTSAVLLGAQYERTLRATATTDLFATTTVRRVASGDGRAVGLRLHDGTKAICVGWSATHVFFSTQLGASIGTTVAVDAGSHAIEVRRLSDRDGGAGGGVELLVDGVLRATVAYAAFDASALRKVQFGSFSVAATADAHWSSVEVYTRDEHTNFWNAYRAGDGSVLTAQPARLSSSGSFFSAVYSAGRPVRVTGGTAAHGRNNGRFMVTTVGPAGAYVDVQGRTYPGLEFISADTVRIPAQHFDGFTAEDAGVQASRTTGAGNAGLVWRARYGGVAGNSITTDINATGANQPLSVVVSGPVATPTITVELATTAGVPTSTASQVKAAIEANPASAALVDIALVGNGSGVMVVEAAVALSGGEDGKRLTIAGATTPANNGTRLIATVIDARTARLGAHDALAGLTVEAPTATWRKDPNFSTEGSLSWEVQGAGTVTGGGQVLTFQTALYASPLALQVLYRTLLTGAILANEFEVDATPPQAFYIADPYAFIRQLVDAITVAGVLPRFR
jgi:hypothetical protein